MCRGLNGLKRPCALAAQIWVKILRLCSGERQIVLTFTSQHRPKFEKSTKPPFEPCAANVSKEPISSNAAQSMNVYFQRFSDLYLSKAR